MALAPSGAQQRDHRRFRGLCPDRERASSGRTVAWLCSRGRGDRVAGRTGTVNLKPCAEQGCGALIPIGQRRCFRHRHLEDRRRDRSRRMRGRRTGSTTAWRRLREQVLKAYGHQCAATKDGVRCGETERLEVHHLDGDQANDAISNLVPLCHEHHRFFEQR